MMIFLDLVSHLLCWPATGPDFAAGGEGVSSSAVGLEGYYKEEKWALANSISGFFSSRLTPPGDFNATNTRPEKNNISILRVMSSHFLRSNTSSSEAIIRISRRCSNFPPLQSQLHLDVCAGLGRCTVEAGETVGGVSPAGANQRLT